MQNQDLVVVLPTKNRPRQLGIFVDDFLANAPKSWKLAISDNSEEINQTIKNKETDRLKYNHTPNPIPIRDNFEIAITMVKADWYLFVGDDDFVNYKLDLKVDNTVDLINGKVAYYWWPELLDEESKNGGLNSKSLKRNIRGLNKFLSNGASNIFDLPWVYHGIMSHAFLNRLEKKFDRICLGPSPDISLAIQSLLLEPNILVVNEFISVFGASINSGGGMTKRNLHRGSLDKPWLPNNLAENWPNWLPMYWSQHTIYPYTAYLICGDSAINKFKVKFRCFKYDNVKPKNTLLNIVFQILILFQEIVLNKQKAKEKVNIIPTKTDNIWNILEELETY